MKKLYFVRSLAIFRQDAFLTQKGIPFPDCCKIRLCCVVWNAWRPYPLNNFSGSICKQKYSLIDYCCLGTSFHYIWKIIILLCLSSAIIYKIHCKANRQCLFLFHVNYLFKIDSLSQNRIPIEVRFCLNEKKMMLWSISAIEFVFWSSDDNE